MKIEQSSRKKNGIWEYQTINELRDPLVLAFGDRTILESEGIYEELKSFYPNGHIVFGSTAGEILGLSVYENALTLTAIEFENTRYEVVTENIKDHNGVESLGRALANKLPKEDLKHVFVISDGTLINGSDLIKGLESDRSINVPITGGLCGDGSRFEETMASYNEDPKRGEVIAIGFYGDSFEITHGHGAGWTTFGPERTVTKSVGNVLYKIDDQPALELYKRYLGDKARELPKAALFFPMGIQQRNDKAPLVRTILSVDERTQSLVLAGDMPTDSKVQLMMSTTTDIVGGAQIAGEKAMEGRNNHPQLAILVSCVGRRLVLDQRTEDEIEEVMAAVGGHTSIAGFYSYGEMGPLRGSHTCQLHNQTMMLTLLSE